MKHYANHKDALVSKILEMNQPNDNPYWAIAVMLTKGKRIIWATDGSLLEIAEHTVKLIGKNKIRLEGAFQILTFSGENARNAMRDMTREPGLTTILFVGDPRHAFPDMSPNKTRIILDEEFVTP